ncbi:non-specific lipid transfer protein GPI-anchored 9-like [Vigna umbellata]|uniref:non-specific lipid transfer protein GPI-anchored 9-like n=1 Tax=Vigna umbellata TaxID=87088 RepID=UPI001F5F066D|nr:non-specific lipid transfer protein GPI-anchored 9-like [Vigna umbellata]XP_047173927.1 non-specific lipid transfer protein GPI-anchored 9-like [Vigna umbellata]
MMKVWMLVLVLSISAIGFCNGLDLPPCLTPLSPCINFLNSTDPPQTCCNPIKEMNAAQNSCFCELALTPPGALEALGITIPQALQLAQSCGVNFKITSCKAPPPSLLPPSATVGGDEGGTCRATFSGFSFALFLGVYAVFN